MSNAKVRIRNSNSPAVAADATLAGQSTLKVSIGHPFAQILKFIERMSTTRWNSRAGLVADVSISFALFYAGLRHGDAHPVAALATVLSGMVLFSLVEYCFHRWLFHGSVRITEQGHRKHHEQPMGYDSLPFFLPPLGMLGLAGLLSLAIPATYACLLAGAVAAGYATYGLSHFVIHNTRFQRSLARRWAAAHHIHHAHPEKNFGVTTPLWDIVLGTRYVSRAKS